MFIGGDTLMLCQDHHCILICNSCYGWVVRLIVLHRVFGTVNEKMAPFMYTHKIIIINTLLQCMNTLVITMIVN